VKVMKNDLLLFETWGGGGWGDPLERDTERVIADVNKGLVSINGALDYGVVFDGEGVFDVEKSSALRLKLREERAEVQLFDKGGSIEELKERCLAETGFAPPSSPRFTGRKQDLSV
jgi:N-methylhydantoinase B